MKIATWNVNGVRARAAQLHEWMERERPDVVCLQELKAELTQIPEVVQRQDYHAFWHCCKGYSGVSLQLRKDSFPAEPVYRHPPFDLESRMVTAELDDLVIASIYVPNGGKDYPAKIGFIRGGDRVGRRAARNGRELLICGDLNIARAEMDVHPRERKPNAVGQRPEERALFQQLLATGLIDVGSGHGPRQRRPVHLVGALAESSGPQHRLAVGLHVGVSRPLRSGAELRRSGGRGHQRSRAGSDGGGKAVRR